MTQIDNEELERDLKLAIKWFKESLGHVRGGRPTLASECIGFARVGSIALRLERMREVMEK